MTLSRLSFFHKSTNSDDNNNDNNNNTKQTTTVREKYAEYKVRNCSQNAKQEADKKII